jgi:integrative and conjugative element protein (TIGR02256 family)
LSSLHYKSPDNLFAIKVNQIELNTILRICADAQGNETGGLLIGHYNDNHNCAIVMEVTGPSADSSSGKTWFYRGVGGLQKLLNTAWRRRRQYYLGEWHFHPGASSVLSGDDTDAMSNTANSLRYNCPEPLLLIIGGKPGLKWSASAYVFPRKKNYTILELVNDL